MKIPFCKTTLGEEEKKAVADVIDSGWVVMGEKTKEFEEKFAEYVGAKYAVFVDSGTAALFLASKWFWGKGEYQIRVPSLTFTSTAEVIKNTGNIPIFVDVNKKTFCLDNTPSSSIAVHLTGNRAKASSQIYDSAHRIEKNDIGVNLALWCYSFYATKNMTTGNGGMIATNDSNAYEWLKKARDHGISQGTIERYKEGKWEYEIEFIGWREKADDIRAAIGLEQLKKLPRMTEERNRVVKHYNALFGLERTGNHIYPVLVEKRAEFINFMLNRGIHTSVHFLPLHRMPAYKDFPREDLPNTEYLGERLVSLPLFPQLKTEEIIYIADSVKESGLLINE